VTGKVNSTTSAVKRITFSVRNVDDWIISMCTETELSKFGI